MATPGRPGDLPDPLETEREQVAGEIRRIYLASRWMGPIGCAVAASLLTVILWDGMQQQRLTAWFATSLVICVAMASGFGVPVIADKLGGNGLPHLTNLSHTAIGFAFGSLLWLDPIAVADDVTRWTVLTVLFAISAGVATGLSGLNSLGMRVIVPIWGLTSAALFRHGEYLVASAGVIFLLIIVIDQRQSGSLWRELIVLRIREKHQAESNAWQATHDGLTGLLNRSGVMAMLEAERPATTAMFIDLDHFKEVNDRFGHSAGDEVLRQVARRLQGSVRRSDAIARIGGDEFFIVFSGVLSEDNAMAVGQAIIAALEEPFRLPDLGEVWISASVGYTSLQPDDVDPSRLMVEADHAMLQAKRRGRRQVAAFTRNLEEQLQARSGLESAFRKAVRSGRIGCAAQPVFDLATGDVHCVELLARWTLDSGTQVPPSIFVPLAEEVGLIDELTEQLLDEAGRLLTEWEHHPHMALAKVSVNVSPVQVAKGKLVETVAGVIERHHIRPGQLILELTESATLSEMRSTVELFNELRDLGVALAVDDFGTGYSSLGHLLSLPVTAVKIDRSLIARLGADPRQQAVMVAVRDLAKVLGHEVIAEGVENRRQIEALLSMGIRTGQGYGLCRPVPVDDLLDQIAMADWRSASATVEIAR